MSMGEMKSSEYRGMTVPGSVTAYMFEWLEWNTVTVKQRQLFSSVGATTFGTTTLSIMTLSMMTLSVMTLSIMTLSMMTFSKTIMSLTKLILITLIKATQSITTKSSRTPSIVILNMKLSIKTDNAILSIKTVSITTLNKQHAQLNNTEYYNAKT